MIPVAELGLDPDVEQVLLDIARDENSTLFRVPPRKLHRYAATGGPADLTGLSTAERHLMQTHRVEVARALRDVCRARLWGHPEARYCLTKSTSGSPPATIGLATTAAESALSSSLCDIAPRIGTSILESCKHPSRDHAAGVGTVAMISMRFQPTDLAHLLVGVGFLLEQRFDLAIRTLSRVSSGRGARNLRSYALTNLGLAWESVGQLQRSLDAYLLATCLSGGRHMPVMSALVIAARLGRLNVCDELAAQLDERLSSEDPRVLQFVELQQNQASRRTLHEPSTTGLDPRRLSLRPDGATRRILDATLA